MKVLNLYAGIGGNRRLWNDCEVTAVEYQQDIADLYQRLNPDDTVIAGIDAHQYLLDHYEEFDFIWSSPPCPTHSKMMKATRHDVRAYPDMRLYQEVLFLQHFFEGKWVVENVVPYYKPLIPAVSVGRHIFWANFPVRAHEIPQPAGFIDSASADNGKALKDWLGIHFDDRIYSGTNHCPSQILRNAVHPFLGLEVFTCARNYGQEDMFLCHNTST